jgi:hypothetical protein
VQVLTDPEASGRFRTNSLRAGYAISVLAIFLRLPQSRQCVGFTYIRCLVFEAIHPSRH